MIKVLSGKETACPPKCFRRRRVKFLAVFDHLFFLSRIARHASRPMALSHFPILLFLLPALSCPMFIVGLGTAAPARRYAQKECWEVFSNSDLSRQLDPRSRAIVRKVLT